MQVAIVSNKWRVASPRPGNNLSHVTGSLSSITWCCLARLNRTEVSFDLGGETPIYTGTWCAAYMGRFFEPTLHEQGIFSGCFRGCLTWAGCLFGADLRIWDDSFLSVVEMQFFLINYVCIIITMLPKLLSWSNIFYRLHEQGMFSV